MQDFLSRFALWLLSPLFSPAVPTAIRMRLLRRLGYRIGPGTRVAGGTSLPRRRLRIGADCYLNTAVLLDCTAPIRIDDGVAIGPRAQLLTSTHAIGVSRGRANSSPIAAPVHVGSGAWLGSGVIVLPGVSIAPGCVIGAGAVVTRSTRPDGVYVGVPARRVRDLDPLT